MRSSELLRLGFQIYSCIKKELVSWLIPRLLRIESVFFKYKTRNQDDISEKRKPSETI